MMHKIDLSQVPTFYHNYIQLVTEPSLSDAFAQHTTELFSFLKGIDEEKWTYRYAEGKWSIKEVVQHLIDAERIFNYRSLTFARKDAIALPGFKETIYAQHSKADKRTKEDLIKELNIVQKSSQMLFSSFDDEALEQKGVMNGNNVYVEAIGYIIIGHARHHKNILQERYL